MQDVQSLIRQARDENWEELDLSGMELTELPIEVCNWWDYDGLRLAIGHRSNSAEILWVSCRRLYLN